MADDHPGAEATGDRPVEHRQDDESADGPVEGESAEPTDGDPGIAARTTDRRTLSPRVRVQWAISALVSALVLGVIATVLAVQVRLDPRLGAGLGVLVGLLGLAAVGLRYRRWAYELRTDALYLERGVLTHRRTLAPFVRIQHVDTARGPVERALGLSTLVVYTAGSRGADISIPGLTPEEADDLQRRVKELAIEAEGGDAL